MMETLTKENLINWIQEISEATEHFDCEYDFQFNLALKIKEKIKDAHIGFEKKIYDDNIRSRCDLVIFPNKKSERILIELKYVCTECQSDKRTLSPRESFVQDYNRIKNLISKNMAKGGFVIFLTNKTSACNNKNGWQRSKKDRIKEFHKKFSSQGWQDCKFKDYKDYKDTKLLVVEVTNEK